MLLLRRPAPLLTLLLLLAGSTVPVLLAEEPSNVAAPAEGTDEEVPDGPEADEAPPAAHPALANPWDDPGLLFERRFVDVRTGQPVAGVSVRVYSEVPHPQPGSRPPMASATSGADGVARIRLEQLDPALLQRYGGPHIAIAEASGFACVGEHARRWFNDWLLRPGERVCVTVVDELDRPVEGALLGWVLGCGHCPDVKQASTDAEGRACFEGVGRSEHEFDPDLWIVKPGYVAQLVTRVPEPDEPIRLRRARVLEGVVLDSNGQPVADAAVGVRHHHHRGPWTRTNAQGRFALVGVPEDGPSLSLYVELTEYPIDQHDPPYALGLALPARDRPLLLRLPPAGAPAWVGGDAEPSSAPEQAEAPRSSAVAVEVRLGPAQAPLAEHDPVLRCAVIAMRRPDGLTVRGELGPQGQADLVLPAGLYDVLARAWQEDLTEVPCAVQRGALLVAPGQPARIRLLLPAPRRVRLSLPAADVAQEAWLCAAGRSGLVSLSEAEPTLVLVPSEGEVAVRVADLDGRRTFPLDPSRAEVVELRLPRRTVSVTLLDGSGRAVRGWLQASLRSEPLEGYPPQAFSRGPGDTEQLPGEPSATPSLNLRIEAGVRLMAWPEEASGCWPLEIPLPLLQASLLALDLGPVRLPPRAPDLTLLRPDGTPLRDAAVELRNGARRATFSLPSGGPLGEVLTDDWRAPGLIVPGAHVRVTRWHVPPQPDESVVCVPFETRLDGPGPWTVSPPSGVLEVEVVREARVEPPLLTLSVDGVFPATRVPERLVRVLGLAPGAHEAVLRSEGHVGRRLRFTLAASEVRRWTAHLRAR